MKPTLSLPALLSLVPFVAAFWRLECFGTAAVARLDPIVNPGETSGHAHLIHGSSGLSDNSTAEDLLKASCSSCQVKQDHSAYWEPQLYFMNSNGSAMLVNETPGHLTYYKYTPIYSSEGALMQPEVLPNGLKVISGDTFRRNFTLPVPDPPLPWSGADATQDALAQKAIGFNCLNYQKKPEGSLYRHFLPDKQYLETECPDGIRMEVLFPQCWNGELDSPDHKSHMAYGDAGLNGGKCPPGYNRTTMQIFYETIYPTQNFKGVDGFYAFSNGDPTGYGFHGDLMIAWEEGVLQKALDACGSDTTGDDISGVITDCPIFDVTSPADQDKCLIPDSQQPANLLKTPVMPSLPGNNPIQSGPQAATMAHGDAPKTQSYKAPATSLVPTLSYSQGTANILKVDPTPSAKALAALPVAQHESASSTSSAPRSTITAAPPAPPAAANNVVPQLSTVTYTSNGIVYEEALVVDEVTVTDLDVVTVTEPAARKRRDDHRRRHNHARFHQH